MPRQTPAERLEALRQRQKQLASQIEALQARETARQRKADTRRKIIAGALALEHMEANPDSEFARVLGRLLDRYVTRSADRALFPALPPVRDSNQPETAATGTG